MARTLASLGGYACAVSDDALWVNLYIQGSVNATVAGRKVMLDVTTDYPWDGRVVLKPRVDGPTKFELRLRVPGWCDEATVAVGGQKISQPALWIVATSCLRREWKTGDAVELNLPMPVKLHGRESRT